MRRNPLKDGIKSEYSFGLGAVTRRTVLTRAEELATIRGDWLHEVPASDTDPAPLPAGEVTAKNL